MHLARLVATKLIALMALMALLPLSGARSAPPPAPVTTVYLVPSSDLPTTVLSDAEIARTAQALTDWANAGLAPAWRLSAVKVVAVPRGAPALPSTAWYLSLMPRTDALGVTGYHFESKTGVPYGEIGVEDAINYDFTWTVCVSHELAEMLVNPYTNYFALNGSGKTAFAREVGDPVSNSSYKWRENGITYRFTDFVYPSYFTPGAPYPYDKMHLITRPFGFLQGDYQLVFGAGPLIPLAKG